VAERTGIKLSSLAKDLGLTARDVYEALLSYGNLNQRKVLAYSGEDLVIPESLHAELLEINDHLQELIYSEVLIEETASTQIPFDSMPRVYFLLDGKVIVYIGQSLSIAGRINKHSESKTFNRVATFKVTQDELSITEAMNINYYHPVYNIHTALTGQYIENILSRVSVW